VKYRLMIVRKDATSAIKNWRPVWMQVAIECVVAGSMVTVVAVESMVAGSMAIVVFRRKMKLNI
jgi:hypothetical protein